MGCCILLYLPWGTKTQNQDDKANYYDLESPFKSFPWAWYVNLETIFDRGLSSIFGEKNAQITNVIDAIFISREKFGKQKTQN